MPKAKIRTEVSDFGNYTKVYDTKTDRYLGEITKIEYPVVKNGYTSRITLETRYEVRHPGQEYIEQEFFGPCFKTRREAIASFFEN